MQFKCAIQMCAIINLISRIKMFCIIKEALSLSQRSKSLNSVLSKFKSNIINWIRISNLEPRT